MKYKTVIEIVSEAGNSTEAADIAGEYLRGYLDTGVSMKCWTKSLDKLSKIRIISGILIFLSLLTIACLNLRTSAVYAERASKESISAIQPPLKTYMVDQNFMREWQKKKNAVELDYIKK